ncbi:hypothetical protein ACN8ZM_40320 (plasmid) [Burkholderia aenigmatica]|uniref:hypothetical protein n=1 Tax=Burkholderia aenigmatica TaxID=2015348 RepID=UPI003B4393BB
MKNRILEITRNTIPYVKELMPLARSVTSCLLMQQLDYWFSTYPDGFWKFQDVAPKHPWYRPGTSWAEELGFSVKEFRTAFDNIGVRYTSKSEWVSGNGDFKGLFYACYTDKREGTTWYFRNHALVDSALDVLMREPPATRGKAMPDGSGGAAPTQGEPPVTPEALKSALERGEIAAREGAAAAAIPASHVDSDRIESLTQVIDFIPDDQTAFTVSATSEATRSGSSYPQAADFAHASQVIDSLADAERAFTANVPQAIDFAPDTERVLPVDSLSEGDLICKQRLVTDIKTTTTVPHSDSTVDRVAADSAACENRGCCDEEKSLNPEPPPASVIEPPASHRSSHAEADTASVADVAPALVFPSKLYVQEREQLEAMIEGCPSFARQSVLDEIAGALAKPGTIRRSTLSYARGLINSVHRTNTFIPALGVAIRACRENELARLACDEAANRAAHGCAAGQAPSGGIRILTDEEMACLPAGMRAAATESRERQLAALESSRRAGAAGSPNGACSK